MRETSCQDLDRANSQDSGKLDCNESEEENRVIVIQCDDCVQDVFDCSFSCWSENT